MSFMKQDVNFNLIFLVGVIITATILLTLYFTHAIGTVNVDYNQLESDLKTTTLNLTQTTNNLAKCKQEKFNVSTELNETKNIEEKAREEYNQIYEDVEGELTETQMVLKEKKDQLEKTLVELKDTTNELNSKTAALSSAENEIESLEKKVDKLEKKEKELEDLQDDMATCKANDDLACYKGLS